MDIKLIAFVAVGGVLGLAYNRIIGCRSGACPITANPYISTAYGALMGCLASSAWR